MSDPSTPPALRERASEDPWTIVLRVVHNLRRDGIRADTPAHRMPAAVRHAARLLEVLGVHAERPMRRATAHRLPCRDKSVNRGTGGCCKSAGEDSGE
jgi:hypothetical protein